MTRHLDKIASATMFGFDGRLVNVLSNDYTRGYEHLPESIKSPRLKELYGELTYMCMDAFAWILEKAYNTGLITRTEAEEAITKHYK